MDQIQREKFSPGLCKQTSSNKVGNASVNPSCSVSVWEIDTTSDLKEAFPPARIGTPNKEMRNKLPLPLPSTIGSRIRNRNEKHDFPLIGAITQLYLQNHVTALLS
ncbi:hypothetical protein chiPu_0028698 [Chiloscyllium punctatum]|uniref:Uncharacterized protein n=1 Tax=Chiloscyllium punctatum TaxID=137246 RepID=A0A401TNV8_CHIPU|nr:hypothetical protein [Chiloscyllium punctatum]